MHIPPQAFNKKSLSNGVPGGPVPAGSVRSQVEKFRKVQSSNLRPAQELSKDLNTALDHVRFLLGLLPSWCIDPDPMLVGYGRTYTEELECASKVKQIREWETQTRSAQ